VLSSQIEGMQSSLQNLLAAEAQDPHGPADVSEVVNYLRAMNYGLARLAELPVSVRLIREIHTELMRSGRVTPGQLCTSQNWIGPAGSTLREATFVPPPLHEVPQALSHFKRFLYSDSS
jgi:Fic family protein